MQKKLVTSAALVGLLMGVAACGEPAEETENAEGAPEQGEQQGSGEGSAEGEEMEMPEADTSDIPDVVAEVDGEEISGEEFTAVYESQFQQIAMQAQMSGEEVDQDELKSQALDTMVGNELMLQHAQDQGHEASEEEIDELLELAAEESGLESVDDLIGAYEEQGMSEEQLRSDAEDQVLLDELVEDLDVEEPSEEELEQAYEEMTAQQEQLPEAEGGEEAETPSFDEMRDQLEQQAIAQNEEEARTALVEDLREDADVETHLEG